MDLSHLLLIETNMISEDLNSFMNLIDVDESFVDNRLSGIYSKQHLTDKNLSDVILLLQYKTFINIQDDDECTNDSEYTFLTKIVHQTHDENIDKVCVLTKIVLNLNKSSLQSKAEHFLQQILCEAFSIIEEQSNVQEEKDQSSKVFYLLKVCVSILDVLIENGIKASLPFLEVPFDALLRQDKKVSNLFLVCFVPKLFTAITDYNVLDKLWEFIQNQKQLILSLRVLSALADFYIPVPDNASKCTVESSIVYQIVFWQIIMSGLKHGDSTYSKISLYLAKRSIDCISNLKKEVQVRDSTGVLIINFKHQKDQEEWCRYFILLESLKEKQINIVLPSLQLFDQIKSISPKWLDCLFQIGLNHDNTEVKIKCLEKRLQYSVDDSSNAVVLLSALNDLDVCDRCDRSKLSLSFRRLYSDPKIFFHLLKGVTQIKWSPIALYNTLNILCPEKNIMLDCDVEIITQLLIDIIKMPCNIVRLKKEVEIKVLNIAMHIENITWKSMTKVMALVLNKQNDLTMFNYLKAIRVSENEKCHFYEHLLDSYMNIPVLLLQFKTIDENDKTTLLQRITKKSGKIQDILLRQYSNKKECFNEFVYLSHLYYRLHSEIDVLFIKLGTKILLQYFTTLLMDNLDLDAEEFHLCLRGLSKLNISLLSDDKIIINLYKVAITMLSDYRGHNLQNKIMCINTINLLTKFIYNSHNRNEMLKMIQVIEMRQYVQIDSNNESTGRLINNFYESNCQVLLQYLTLCNTDVINNLEGLLNFVEHVSQCGGYGCLKWILKIMYCLIPTILEKEKHFNLETFLSRIWKEIEEVKSNNQYMPCIEAFIDLLLLDVIIKKPCYNNMLIYYFKNIIQYGSTSVAPLKYFVDSLDKKVDLDCGQLIYILHEVLLFAPVLRKDQRLTEKIVKTISENSSTFIFNHEVQQCGISILLRITDEATLASIIKLLLNKIDDVFKNKVRYHGDSQPHRTVMIVLQHVLFISLIQTKCVSEEVLEWCVKFLNKLPHQPSVRLCLEWYIALYICVQKLKLKHETMQMIHFSQLPQLSQMCVLYYVLRHRIIQKTHDTEEYQYVMDFLLSHSMGQLFNVRLHAQYLSMKLYELNSHPKYEYTMLLIDRTFKDCANEKSLIKLQNEFFVNTFDVVGHLTPNCIYSFLPNYFNMDGGFTVSEFDSIEYINRFNKSDFTIMWLKCHMSDKEVMKYKVLHDNKYQCTGEFESNGNIQKKYVPWKNMLDIETCEIKKKKREGELVVVASLVDKLPNLGGIARTSEVFGVQTCVFASLRQLQDPQFQGLSVSAEKWVDVVEVRPGSPLKDYLSTKKSEGYTIIAAEQTSNSVLLTKFRFPKKTVLLLGHEKEGVPCDLLPYMDHCVEIPQQGVIRSLNVHVTAAIFVWEYARQINMQCL